MEFLFFAFDEYYLILMILMTGNVKSCLAGKMITEQLILLLRIKLINKNFLLIRMLENDAQNLYENY